MNSAIVKQGMDNYLKIHTEIVSRFMSFAKKKDARLPELLKDRTLWEEWLSTRAPEALDTIRRERKAANDLWVAAQDDEQSVARFRSQMETEYMLAIWAAKSYLKWLDAEFQIKALQAMGAVEGKMDMGHVRYGA